MDNFGNLKLIYYYTLIKMFHLQLMDLNMDQCLVKHLYLLNIH